MNPNDANVLMLESVIVTCGCLLVNGMKTSTLKREDLDEFVQCYHPANRHDRKPTWSVDNPDGRWRAYDYEELINRDKASLDIFWLRDESLSDSDNLPAPEVIAAEIVEDLEAALEQFREILGDMGPEVGPEGCTQPGGEMNQPVNHMSQL